MLGERDDLPKHLELIRGVVERHARGSFVLKGGSVTLVAFAFLLAARDAEPNGAMAAGLLPAPPFRGSLGASWCLLPPTGADVPDDRCSLDARPFKEAVQCWPGTLQAPSVFWFHCVVLSVAAVALAFFSLRVADVSQGLLQLPL